MKLFVGNLPFAITERELRDLFAAHAAVSDVKIVRDAESGKSRGFGFVELMMESDAKAVVAAMDGERVNGRPLKVEIAKDSNGGSGHPGRRRDRQAAAARDY
jgi:cold-inducible RNA-binding protein